MRRVLALLSIALAFGATAAQASRSDAMIERLKPLVVADPDKAIATIRQERRQASRLSNRRERALAIATTDWLEGDAEVRLNRLETGDALLRKAGSVAEALAPRSRLHAFVLLSRGNLDASRGRVAAALADNQAAFRMFRALGDARSQAIVLLYISAFYLDARDYQAVLRYADQAYDIYHADPLIALTIANSRGNALTEIGRAAEAQAQYEMALPAIRTLKSPLLEAQVLRNIARAQLAAGRLPAAERTMRAGWRVSRMAGPSDERAMLALAAEVMLRHRRMAEAEALIGRSFDGVDLATTSQASRDAHETAYEIYRAVGDQTRALAHLEAQRRLDDQSTKLATTTSTQLMAARFDFANQELRIANLQRDEANRRAEMQRARAETQEMLFAGGLAAVAVIILLLLVGLFTLRRSRDRLRATAAKLAETNGALGTALAARTEFLATTSHEIRTPLNGILGMTQVMLADRGLDPAVRDRLDVVHAAGTTMRALVDDILDVAKMETGKLTLESACFDLQATLRDAARLWEDQAAGKGIALTLDLDDCPTHVTGDAARTRQVVFNLLSNAIKFTREGEVALAARRERGSCDRIAITVSDTGVGIARDKLPVIFESFRQADAGTTREFGGTGLGLTICRNLAEAMGGGITVESTPGVGSSFTVTLPLVAAERPAEVRAATLGLLVLERNPIARSMLRTLFEAEAGDVALAANLDEALDLLSARGARRVLAEQATLAAEGDPAAALALLVQAAGADVPVFVLTTETGSALPGAERLQKPIVGADLVARVLQAPFIASEADALVSRAA